MGGFNLPPGCTTKDIEDACGDNMPAACDSCRYIDPKTDELICPFNDQYEYCPEVALVEKCEICKKPLKLVVGVIKFKTMGIMSELYCCSQECLDKLKAEVDKEILEMMSGQHL